MSKDSKFTLHLRCPYCESIVRLAVDLSLYQVYAICDECAFAWDERGVEVTNMNLVAGL